MFKYHPINEPKSKADLKWAYVKAYWSFFNPLAWYDIIFKCQHDYDDTTRVKKETYEDHEHTNIEFIYTVNTRKCKCGQILYDAGCEHRDDQFRSLKDILNDRK